MLAVLRHSSLPCSIPRAQCPLLTHNHTAPSCLGPLWSYFLCRVMLAVVTAICWGRPWFPLPYSRPLPPLLFLRKVYKLPGCPPELFLRYTSQ